MADEVRLETSVGRSTLALHAEHAPNACHNFTALADAGYYDGLTFHRVVADFIAQTGDPTGTGRGGESIYGRPFADETTRARKHTGAGIVSMANAGRDTNGSQWFITLAPCPHLDGKHTIFGRVSSGLQTVRRIGLARTDEASRPLDDVLIVCARSASAWGDEPR